MSETDPFAAPEYTGPVVEEARVPLAETVEAPVEAQNAPQTPEQVVPAGSVKEVLAWVSEDPTRAKAALDVETSGDNRKTLIKELNVILNK